MVKSMTGFGRYESVNSDYRVSVEIKSVNHRFCDLNIMQPKKFSAYSNDIRNIVKEYAVRGKIDVYISFENYIAGSSSVKYNPSVARGYMDAITEAAVEFGIEPDITASQLIRFPDVILPVADLDGSDEEFAVVREALHKACIKFKKSRESEGQNLYNDIRTKLSALRLLVRQVEERSPQIVADYRQKLTDKVAGLLGDRGIDESILATEITVYADKICVDEETVRLKSHVANMEAAFLKDEPIGRRLDFIAQEMNREANTILSKSNDVEFSAVAIDLKTLIEKIREQIQNIE